MLSSRSVGRHFTTRRRWVVASKRKQRRNKATILGALALLVWAAGGLGSADASPIALPDGPMVVAHRGGAADFPENTLLAITNSVAAGVDGVWLTVQVSSDGVAVLYRPGDLATLTDGVGPVNSRTGEQLQQLNAGWNFTQAGVNGYPYRQHPTPLPTLEQAIAAVPSDMPLFLDLKQRPAQPLVMAVARVLSNTGAAPRSIIYSTDTEIIEAALHQEGLRVAESRDATRQRLLEMALNSHCTPPPASSRWAGFELHREVTVTEDFTLGVGTTEVNAQLWNPATVECFKSQTDMKIAGFAVNTLDDYQLAKKFGLDAVLVDSPRAARDWRAGQQRRVP